jgi:hypothetical protein
MLHGTSLSPYFRNFPPFLLLFLILSSNILPLKKQDDLDKKSLYISPILDTKQRGRIVDS